MDDHYGIEASGDAEARRVVLTGEIDLSAHDALLATFTSELAGSSECLIVDLSEVTFLDSTGINALLAGHKEAMASGKRFVVVPGPDQVMHTLRLTGVDTVLDISGTANA